MIVLDTSVLSLAFRREGSNVSSPTRERLGDLIARDEDLRVPGIVLLEILSGVTTKRSLSALEDALSGFPIVLATRADHARAVEIRTACRAKGIAAATVDCLIAAQSLNLDARLFTTDEDFTHMTKACKLKLL